MSKGCQNGPRNDAKASTEKGEGNIEKQCFAVCNIMQIHYTIYENKVSQCLCANSEPINEIQTTLANPSKNKANFMLENLMRKL